MEQRPTKRARENPKTWADYMMRLDRDSRFVVAKQLDLVDVYSMCHVSRALFDWCNSYDLYNKLFREWYGVEEWRKTRDVFVENFGNKINPFWMLIAYHHVRKTKKRYMNIEFDFVKQNERVSTVFRKYRTNQNIIRTLEISRMKISTYIELTQNPAFFKLYALSNGYKTLPLILPEDDESARYRIDEFQAKPIDINFFMVTIYVLLKIGFSWLHQYSYPDENYEWRYLSIRSHICTTCAQPAETPQVCGACQKAVYCSAKCQRKDWIAGHAHRCMHNHYKAEIDPYYVDNIELRTLNTQTQGPNVIYMANRPSFPRV